MGTVNVSWDLYYFALFRDIINQLIIDVEKIQHEKSFDEFKKHPKTKLLKSVFEQITDEVPTNPNNSKFILGHTLGKQHADWRRIKKGLPPRYRLFFKFTTAKKSIIYAWLNDETTLRKAGSKTDAYAVFSKMLESGTIPSSIEELLNHSSLNKPN